MSIDKKAYEVELKRVFDSLIVNYPHLYKGLNFSDLAADWYRLFTKNDISADLIFPIYENAIQYKAEKGNDFGAVSGLDMLAAYKRIANMTVGTKKKVKCEVCGGDGYVSAYDIDKKKEELRKCPKLH